MGGVVASSVIQRLSEFGQSIWLDYISRSLLDTGKLQRLIGQGVSGLTSNPTIFDKAISKGNDYDQIIRKMKGEEKTTFQMYDDITVRDVQDAADLFLPTYERTGGIDGYVSLEIDPMLAYDTEKTIAEGRRLFKKVDRANIMFKVPATDEGFPAVTALLTDGINVNVTLIFSLQQYINTANAYVRGVEEFLRRGGQADRVHSVASVFVSRVDTLTDKLIDELLQKENATHSVEIRDDLKGRAAVANAAIIYERYREFFNNEEFKVIEDRGGNTQRLLWGSTSTKNPAYSDIKYVTELIGKGTVNTVPEDTLEAFLDHGTVVASLPGEVGSAERVIDELRAIGIDINEVCQRLLKDGVVAFQKSFSSLLRAIEEKAVEL
jgi:transaldolase